MKSVRYQSSQLRRKQQHADIIFNYKMWWLNVISVEHKSLDILIDNI